MEKILNEKQLDTYFMLAKKSGYSAEDAITFYGIFELAKSIQTNGQASELEDSINQLENNE